jgi:hypothetical protein
MHRIELVRFQECRGWAFGYGLPSPHRQPVRVEDRPAPDLASSAVTCPARSKMPRAWTIPTGPSRMPRTTRHQAAGEVL